LSGVLAGIGSAALFRLLLMAGRAAGPVPADVAAVLVMLLTVCLVIALALTSWQNYVRQPSAGASTTRLAVAIACVFASVEAVAALGTVLWHGTSLWAIERYFLWHLADSVPLVGLPEGVGWAQPMLRGTHAAATFLLIFKLVLIGPVLRLATATYRAFATAEAAYTARWIREEATRQASGWSPPARELAARGFWRENRRMLATVAGGYAILVLLVNGDGFALDAIRAWRGSSWAAAVVQVIAFLAVVGLALVPIRSRLAYFFIWDRPSLLAAAVVRSVVVAAAMFLLGTVVLVAFETVGWVGVRPPVQSAGRVNTAMAAQAWHLAHALPGLDITGATGWRLRHDFTGLVATMTVMLTKAAVFISLLLFAGRAILKYVQLSGSTLAEGPSIELPVRFGERLVRLHALLRAQQRQLIEGSRHSVDGESELDELRELMMRLDTELAPEVMGHAHRAITALQDHRSALSFLARGADGPTPARHVFLLSLGRSLPIQAALHQINDASGSHIAAYMRAVRDAVQAQAIAADQLIDAPNHPS
jgi:hypothetical protein